MKRTSPYYAVAFAIACAAFAARAEDAAAPAQPGGGTTVYRQVMPDGRIVYSDKVVKGGKLDQTITIEPPIKGNLWTTESGNRPAIPPQVEPTPIHRVNSIPAPGKKKTNEEATSDVIRAEMLLEDARKRQQAGVEPLPGERTGNAGGGSRLNEAYRARQQTLAKETEDADAALKRAIAERDALRSAR